MKRFTIYERDPLDNSNETLTDLHGQRDEITHLSFYVRGWSLSQHASIADYIGSSESLRSVRVSWGDRSLFRELPVDYDLVNSCLEAASRNTSVQSLDYSTAIGKGLTSGVLTALETGREKLSELSLRQNEHVIDSVDVSALSMCVAGLEKLKKLALFRPSDMFWLQLMHDLSAKKKPLEELELRQYELGNQLLRTHGLAGIDSFLASNGGRNLKKLDVWVDCVSTDGMEHLVAGLPHTCIERLDFRVRHSSQQQSRLLADLIRSIPLTLKTLVLEGRGESFQDDVLPALYDATMQEVSLRGVFDITCEHSVKDLLIQNTSIKILTCEADGQLSNVGIKDMAAGLSQNSTLDSLILEAYHHDTLEYGAIFGGLLKPNSLQKISIQGATFSNGSAEEIAKWMQHPQFNSSLKELDIVGDLDGLSFLPILNAAADSTSLRKYQFYGDINLSREGWSEVANIVRRMKIVDINVDSGGEVHNPAAVPSICEELLQAVEHNEALEAANFHFFDEAYDSAEFFASLDRYCLRNKATKASKALQKHPDTGGLPAAAVPRVLHSIASQSQSNNEKDKLCSLVVYSFLKEEIGCPNSDLWKSKKKWFADVANYESQCAAGLHDLALN